MKGNLIDPTIFPHTGEVDVDQLMRDSVGERFHANASLEEGISGQLAIDTEYENNVEEHLSVVSSDRTRYENLPAPRDVKAPTYPWRKA